MNLKSFLAEHKIPLDKGLFLVYGKAGVGKTTFLMELLKESKTKAFLIDCEEGFSTERFMQITDDKEKLQHLMLTRPKDFEQQAKVIGNIIGSAQHFDFIGIDTIGKHYREAVKKEQKVSNNELARQMRVLKELSRNRPVIVCNQVYSNIREKSIEPLGKDYVKKWCDYIFFLDQENNERKLEIKKPEEVSVSFTLSDEGFNFD